MSGVLCTLHCMLLTFKDLAALQDTIGGEEILWKIARQRQVKNNLEMYDDTEARWAPAVTVTDLLSGSKYLIESLSRDRGQLRIEVNDMEDVDAITLLSMFTTMGESGLMVLTDHVGNSNVLPLATRNKRAVHASYGVNLNFPKVAKLYMCMGASQCIKKLDTFTCTYG